MKTNKLLSSLASLALTCGLTQAAPLGTAFTYQGRLGSGASFVTGLYDLRFTLFNALTGGNQVGVALINSAVPVSNGLFSASLNFGTNIFDGNARFLEIGVRTNVATNALFSPMSFGSPFSTLSPRQGLTPTPHSVYAAFADEARIAAIATTVAPGAVPSSVLVVSNETSSATPTELFVAGSGNRLTIPRGSAWTFDVLVVGRTKETGQLDLASKAAYQLRGLIEFDGSGVHVYGKTATVLYESEPAYDANVDPDPASNALVVRVTGAAGRRMRWVATVRLAEVMSP